MNTLKMKMAVKVETCWDQFKQKYFYLYLKFCNKISQNNSHSQTYPCRGTPGIRCALCETSERWRVLLVDGDVLSIIDRVKRSAVREETAGTYKIENIRNITFNLKIGKKQPLLNFNGGTPRSKSRNASIQVTEHLGPSHGTPSPTRGNTSDIHSTGRSNSQNTSNALGTPQSNSRNMSVERTQNLGPSRRTPRSDSLNA